MLFVTHREAVGEEHQQRRKTTTAKATSLPVSCIIHFFAGRKEQLC